MDQFEDRADDIVEIVKPGIFVVFGALLAFGGLFEDGWATVAIAAFTLLAARTIAIWIALADTKIDTATKGFMAWFGPKGVATMTFSIIVHGLSDTPGSEWLATRRGEPETTA